MHREKTASEKEKQSVFEKRVQETFIESDENLISILGTSTAKMFFSTGALRNGFAILSDRRMYFKGRCYVRVGKGFVKKMEERVVDLGDITGTGFVHSQNIITKILYYIAFAISCIVWVSWPFWVVYFISGKQWAKKTAWGIQCLVWPMPLFYLLNKAFNYSLFEVSYAGGGIAFDLSWITKADSDSFQKSLQSAKSYYKKKSQHNDFMPPKPEKEHSIIEQLKGYKELFDNGILTAEEFEKKKRALLEKDEH